MSSLSESGRVRSFPRAVRERDGRCVITGGTPTQGQLLRNRWPGYQAAHIFPLALEATFADYNFGPLVILNESDGRVNSPQNGLLLRNDIYSLFDQYEISINPNACIQF
jgi:hypothetical protein